MPDQGDDGADPNERWAGLVSRRHVIWLIVTILVVLFLLALGRRFSRFVGLIILAAQLPGDVQEFLEDLVESPRATLGALSYREVWHFFKCAVVFPQKMSLLGEDKALQEMDALRQRYVESSGWQRVAFKAKDGVALDGCMVKPPPGGRQGWVVFMNANMQRYEEWLFYFTRYVMEARVGMLVFNWRGVGYSDGAIYSIADMVSDGEGALKFILDEGVPAEQIILHGLSIGACIAAHVAGSQPKGAQPATLLDRPFSTLYAVVDGYVAFATAPVPGARGSCLKRCFFTCFAKSVASLIWLILIATGWQGRTSRAWRRVHSMRIVTFHRRDNIIHYACASLHHALLRAKDLPGDPQNPAWHAVELRTLDRRWLPHDMPLYLDGDWPSIQRLIWEAIGAVDELRRDSAGQAATGDHRKPPWAERAITAAKTSLSRAGSTDVRPETRDAADGGGPYTRML